MNSELDIYFCEKFRDEIRAKYIDRYEDFYKSFDDWDFFILTEEDFDEDEIDDGTRPGDYLTYIVFGHYACFMADRINSGQLTDEMLDDFLNIVNEMVDTGDLDIVNMVQTGIFESPLIDTGECINLMRSVLKGEALELYDVAAFNFGNRKYLPREMTEGKEGHIIVYRNSEDEKS